MNSYEFCKRWAADRKCIFEDRGEIGFGRPCVGILRHDHYVEYDYDFDVRAPKNAYHKGPYLAVLAYDDNYEAAVDELASWLRQLERYGVESQDRTPENIVDLIVHGVQAPILVER